MTTFFFIILFVSIIFLILAVLIINFIRKKDKLFRDEPFEFTEYTNSGPTATPVYEKKKKDIKPKKIK